MYISQLKLNRKNRRVLQELRSPYEMHRTLSKAFDYDALPASDGRILFRAEPEEGISLTVLVQSPVKPDWSRLTVDDGYFFNGEPPSVKEFNPAFTTGMKLIFRLRANPVKREKASGKRKGITGEEELIAWLQRKGSAGGFTVHSAEVRKETLTASKIKSEETQHAAQFQSVIFQGILEVTDTNVFHQSIQYGIGAAKGLGFGLLSVAIASE